MAPDPSGLGVVEDTCSPPQSRLWLLHVWGKGAHPKGQPEAFTQPSPTSPSVEMVVQVLGGSLQPHVAFTNLTARKCR